MRLAVLIDAENIAVQHASAIMERARSLGDPNIVRLYGDFSEIRLSGWLDVARAAGHSTMLQLSGQRAKNSTDIALVIDAMDILHAGATDAFCIVSDDRDFVPLVVRLRAAGKRVYVICRKADERLAKLCSGVLLLDQPAKVVVNPKPVAQPAAKPVAKPAKDPPIVAAFKAIAGAEAGTLGLSEVATALRRHQPPFVTSKATGAVRKLLTESGRFEVFGNAPTIRVRLKSHA